MGKINLLVDTDVFIDYLNHDFFSNVFESRKTRIYYSVVTRKELLTKEGLSDSEKVAILKILKKYRVVGLNGQILKSYDQLRQKVPWVAKEDCLIAATALTKNFLLFTRNLKHYRQIAALKLFVSQEV